MRRVADESKRFRSEDVPPRMHEKERVTHAFREIERYLQDSGESLDRDLHPDALDRSWNQLMMLYQVKLSERWSQATQFKGKQTKDH